MIASMNDSSGLPAKAKFFRISKIKDPHGFQHPTSISPVKVLPGFALSETRKKQNPVPL